MPRVACAALRALYAIALFVAFVALPRTAFAWVDLKVAGDDVHVTVERTGKARVEHRVTLLVSGGPLKKVRIKGVDVDAAIEPDGYVILEKDAAKGLSGALPIAVERSVTKVTEGAAEHDRTDLKIDLADGAGIRRGSYVLVVRYTTDLRANGLLTRDGATYLLEWTGPSWDDGLDATKATFILPSAPTEPRVSEPADEDDLGAGTVMSTVHREPTSDVLELSRAYASKGERVVWRARIDTRAFPGESAPDRSAPLPSASPHPRLAAARDTLLLLVATGLFILLSALTAWKTYEVRKLAAERGASPRPLVPLPTLVRAPLAGAALVGGVALEIVQRSGLAGAALVALSSLLVAHRAPKHQAALRGPGRWLSVKVAEALRPAPLPVVYLDARTVRGKLLFVAMLAAAGALAFYLSPTSRFEAALIALDTVPLFALFLTGRLDQMPPDPAAAPAQFFRKVARVIERRSPGARVVPRVRIPEGSADSDELRLLVLPERPLRGLRAIEISVSYAPGIGGYVGMPEVFVRCQAKSDADARAQEHAAHGRILRGRKIDERVLVLAPKLPTARLTAELIVALLTAFTDPSRSTVPPSRRDEADPRRVRVAPIAA